jgi:hypothetical protein
LVLPYLLIYVCLLRNSALSSVRIYNDFLKKRLYLLLIHAGLAKRYTTTNRVLL